MTTTFRRESAPHRGDEERIVVGPALFEAMDGPTVRRPRSVALYVFPDEGAAMLGSARSQRGIREVVEQGVSQRSPEAIWLRDVPWFVDAWGVRATGRLERSLSDLAGRRKLPFVSWLECRTRSTMRGSANCPRPTTTQGASLYE